MHGALLMAGITASLFAHNAWVAKDSTGFKILYGHETTNGYDPAKVKDVSGFGVDGKKVAVTMARADSGVALETTGNPAFFTLHFDNGFYVKTTEGSKNVSKRGIKDYLSASHSIKYTKSVFVWSAALLKPLGEKMEMVPMVDPRTLKTSNLLPVKVFYEGKPLSGAPVSIAGTHGAVDTTDAQGVATVRYNADGSNQISASLKIPLVNDPDADTLSLSGTLHLDFKSKPYTKD